MLPEIPQCSLSPAELLGNLFPGSYRGVETLSDVALAQPLLQSLTLAGIFEIREGFCKEVAAKVCVRARWQRHSHTLVPFRGELGENPSEVGQVLANKEGRVPHGTCWGGTGLAAQT